MRTSIVLAALLTPILITACDGPRQIPDILRDLRAADANGRPRLAAELNKHGAAAVDAWIELLEQKDYGLYFLAAGELGALGEAAAPAIPVLAAYLRDGFPGMKQDEKMTVFDRVEHPDIGRTPARDALKSIGAPAIATARQALTHPVGQTRQEAAFLLGQIGPAAAAAVPDLVLRLADSDKVVVAAAAWSLGNVGTFDETVKKGLQDALFDEHRMVRFEALKAIGKFGAKAVALRELVKKMLEDKEPSVRTMARQVLEERLPVETRQPVAPRSGETKGK